MLIKTWKEQKVSEKLQLGMFTALTEIASKEFTVLTAGEIHPMHSFKEHMTTLSVVCFCNLTIFNLSKYVFNCLSIYMKSIEYTS